MASSAKKDRRASAPKAVQPNKGGRPAYEPAPEDRRLVLVMAAHGIHHSLIGKALSTPCSGVTLRKHFRDELDAARPRWMAQIGEMLHVHVLGRAAEYDRKGRLIRKEIVPNVTATIFQAKVVLGMREVNVTQVIELTQEMVDALSDEDAQSLRSILERAVANLKSPAETKH